MARVFITDSRDGLSHAAAKALINEPRWNFSQAYSDSKLYVTALASAVARRWPDVLATPSIGAGSRRRWAAAEGQTISRWDIVPRPGWRSAMIRLPSLAANTRIIV